MFIFKVYFQGWNGRLKDDEVDMVDDYV